MTPWARLTLPLVAFLLGACSDPLPEVASTSTNGDSAESTSGGPPPPTTSATTPGEDTLGTMGATGMETTMGAVDTTAAVETTTTTGDETTMGVSSASSSGGESSTGEPPPPPECVISDDCGNNEICDAGGDCVSACMPWGTGNYGSCLTDLGVVDAPNICGANHFCLLDEYPYDATVCSAQACATACDCPAPPPTGDATVTCASITMGDMNNDCYLSCADGETCPDGMVCLFDFICMAVNPPMPTYGNCDDLVTTCAVGSCGISGNASVCTEGCGNVGDCPAAPVGFTAACGNVFDPPMGNDCYLSCNFVAGDCPPGMACVDTPGSGGACMF